MKTNDQFSKVRLIIRKILRGSSVCYICNMKKARAIKILHTTHSLCIIMDPNKITVIGVVALAFLLQFFTQQEKLLTNKVGSLAELFKKLDHDFVSQT